MLIDAEVKKEFTLTLDETEMAILTILLGEATVITFDDSHSAYKEDLTRDVFYENALNMYFQITDEWKLKKN